MRAGEGGFPLLLLHGWPETIGIWWRNIEPLAAAGFEVIVPDLRGYGDSGLAADGFYDPAAHAIDMHALVHDVLGHERCVAAGGDVGGVVIQDLGLRFEGFVVRQCLFNTVPPALREEYERGRHWPGRVQRHPDGRRLLHAPGQGRGRSRRRAGHARQAPPLHRAVLWLAVLGRTRCLHTGRHRLHDEPFADPDKLRASFGVYETALGKRAPAEVPRFFETNPVPTLLCTGPRIT